MDLTDGATPAMATGEAALTSLAKRSGNRMIQEVVSPSSRDLIGFVCECADPDCHRVLWLTADAFERASADPTWHALAPAHNASATESLEQL